jgi:RHS repeat-associated protein
MNGFQYLNAVLQFFPTAEGYVKKTGNAYFYVFNYTDHLGSIRMSYSDNNNDGMISLNEIIDTHNYYPFGLEHSNTTISEYKYKFQGQERQDELGLNWDSFKWRNYDYAIGRFMSIDPLAQQYAYNSPYAFSENRVVDARELEGLEKYIVTGRTFIPSPRVDNPLAPVSSTKTYAGDNRQSYQVNTNSYRTEQKVKVDFDNNTANTTSNRANGSTGYDKNGKVAETSQPDKAGPTPTYTQSTMKDGTTTVNMQVDASNKLNSVAPAINYDVNITITPQDNGSFNYSLSGQRDGFPAYEFFVTNQDSGNSYLIYGSNPAQNNEGPTALGPPMEYNFSSSGNSNDLKPVTTVPFGTQ